MAKAMTKAQKVRNIVAKLDKEGAKPKTIVERISKAVDLKEPAARTYMYNARKFLKENAPSKPRKRRAPVAAKSAVAA